MALSARELRIGNYILISILQEDGGFKNELFTVNSTVIRDAEHYGGEWNASPIPLTEEWLVKFGFIKARDEANPYMDGEHTVISGRFTVFSKMPLTFNSVHGWFLNKYQTELIIKYVHQLQNLYFALTGQELN